MARHESISLKTVIEELGKIESGIEGISEAEGWAPDLEFKIKLILDEWCTNVINYAHGDGLVHDMTITIESDDEAVMIEVCDDGRAFDPMSDAPEPDTDASLEERRIGGLGIYFVKSLVDEASYRREEDKNYLTLRKRR